MTYSSLIFIYGFLPLSLLIYHATREKYRNAVLLGLSLIFCGFCGLKCLAFTVLDTAFNFLVGHIIDTHRVRKKSGTLPLVTGITANIAMLFVFRAADLAELREKIGLPEGVMPVGISLFTLSAVGYLIDIYSDRIRAESDPVRFGLYMLMFPRIIMGPVLRYDSFVKILSRRKCSLAETGTGMTIFVKGLAKKVLAADNLFMLYSAVRNVKSGELAAVNAWLGMIAYVLCLYFTVSGLTDMGIGLGRCFGMHFPRCFNYPLFVSKLRYFASRWHMQAVRWFRRYISSPLSAQSSVRWIKKLIFIATWGFFGFWYTFRAGGLIWGLLLGIGIVVERKFAKLKMLNATGIIVTFVFLTVSSVFLAGDNLSASIRYLGAMVGGNRMLADSLTVYLLRSYVIILLVSVYASTDLFRNMLLRSRKNKVNSVLSAATPAIVIVLLLVCTAFIAYGGASALSPVTL